ncbi:hypothetical protein SAMN05216533_2188 [Streptomyces sp. Ag109_O5-10]|nr:hypothetical protein SAMN05216533_2188 [Streptomyces sp. Ag109_O5-10]
MHGEVSDRAGRVTTGPASPCRVPEPDDRQAATDGQPTVTAAKHGPSVNLAHVRRRRTPAAPFYFLGGLTAMSR